MNTATKGMPIVVFNPLNVVREDVVEASVTFPTGMPKAVRVSGPNGKEVPAQISEGKVVFVAKAPSVGYAVYEVHASAGAPGEAAALRGDSESSLENSYYRVKLNTDGDVASIFDKSLGKELLAAPARLAISYDNPEHWPAWNMDWEQRTAAPKAYVGGPARNLAPVVFEQDGAAYPDTLVGTDSHTTMINGLGVVGWGVGGIEAEACMLGQPASMLLPAVVGFKLNGRLPEGSTATDLVLTVTQMLRKKGVVGKFVEFYGDGVGALSLADRATIGNMAPEYGATIGVFPIDHAYARLSAHDQSPAGADRAGGSLREGAGLVPLRRRAASRSIPTRSRSIFRPWFRRSPGPSGRRIASIFRT